LTTRTPNARVITASRAAVSVSEQLITTLGQAGRSRPLASSWAPTAAA
jgi:hypothetical protein